MRAIWSPETGIVDWAEVARHYAKVFTSSGGTVLTDFEAVKFTGDQSEASIHGQSEASIHGQSEACIHGQSEASIHGQSEASINIDQSQSRSRRLWV